MDSKYVPLMMAMMTPIENRSEVTQAVATSLLPLGGNQRAAFAAVAANNSATNHRLDLDQAKRSTASEVIEYLEHAVKTGNFDLDDAARKRFPTVVKTGLAGTCKARLPGVQLPS